VERIIAAVDAPTENADANVDGTVNATDMGVIEYIILEIWPWNHVHIEAPDKLPYCTNFTTYVFITYVENFGSASLTVNYNASILDLQDVTDGKILEVADLYTVNVTGWSQPGGLGMVVINVSIDGNPGVSGAGYLAEIHLHVNGSAGQTSPLAFNVSQSWLKNSVGGIIGTTWEDDFFTVAP
jgi:hypothetical protein